MLMVLFIGGGIAALCTLTRWYLERSGFRRENACHGLVELRPLYNKGAGFGWSWFRGRPLVAACTAAVAVLLFLARQGGGMLMRFGIGLTVGGGASNLWERIRHGRVFDYVRFPHLPGRGKRLVFNLADFFIFLGLALLLAGGHRKK